MDNSSFQQLQSYVMQQREGPVFLANQMEKYRSSDSNLNNQEFYNDLFDQNYQIVDDYSHEDHPPEHSSEENQDKNQQSPQKPDKPSNPNTKQKPPKQQKCQFEKFVDEMKQCFRTHDLEDSPQIITIKQTKPTAIPTVKLESSDIDNQGIKGLKILAYKINQLVTKSGPQGCKNIAEIIISEECDFLDELPPEIKKRQEMNIKRRIYDAINVLISSGVFTRKRGGAIVLATTNRQQQYSEEKQVLKNIRSKISSQLREIQDLINLEEKIDETHFENPNHDVIYNLEEELIWNTPKSDEQLFRQISEELEKNEIYAEKRREEHRLEDELYKKCMHLEMNFEENFKKHMDWRKTLPPEHSGNKKRQQHHKRMVESMMEHNYYLMNEEIEKLVLETRKKVSQIYREKGKNEGTRNEKGKKNKVLKDRDDIPFPKGGFLVRGEFEVKKREGGFTILSDKEPKHLGVIEMAKMVFGANAEKKKEQNGGML